MWLETEMKTNLAADDINGLDPFILKDPVLDNTLEIADGSGIEKVHVRPSMSLN